MYTFLIFAHSWNRWFVLLAFIGCLILLVRGLQEAKSFTKFEVIGQRSFVGLLDLQFMIGLVLLAFTPLISSGGVHHWIFQHVGGMVIGVAIVHAANAIGKKKENAQKRRKTFLIGNLVGLLVIFGSIPWPFMNFARPLFRF